MKNKILLRTNLMVCAATAVGFLLTALLGYRANLTASIKNIEQVSDLTSEGIFYQLSSTFVKPVNISLTMANDSLLHEVLAQESVQPDSAACTQTLRTYLHTYREKYDYDSVFLVSAATARYYNFNGFDRVLVQGDAENDWYFNGLLQSSADYAMNIDNDEVAGADNAITLFVNCKVRDTDGALLGVVGVGVRLDSLQAMLQSYHDEFGVTAYLLDDAGQLQIASQNGAYAEQTLFSQSDAHSLTLQQQVLDWRESSTPLRFWAHERGDKIHNYVVSRYLPEIDWHLVAERDATAMVEALNWQLLRSMLIIALILTLILLTITRVIRRFNRQIVDLTQMREQERQTVFEAQTAQMFEDIYEVDITHNLPANRATELYFESLGVPRGSSFDKALHTVAEKQIKEEFRQGYINTFLPENVLRAYEAGADHLAYEFMTTKDGSKYYWMRITARIVKLESDDSIHMLIYRQNIDAEKRQERRMQLLAQTDEMTGLLTKSATKRHIQQLLLQNPQRTCAYFILDIDNFKLANDLYGHAFGDTVIREFVRILRANFRSDDIIGRIGGDEFAAFVPVPSEEWAQRKALLLCKALDHEHRYDGQCWHMTASIGVAFAPQHGTTAQELYEKADAALYQSKEQGRNRFTVCQSTPPAAPTEKA